MITVFRFLFCALAAAALAAVAGAQDSSPPSADETVRLEALTVLGDSAPGVLDRVPGRLQWSVPTNLAAAVQADPSLAMYSTGAAAPDPLLRGLGADRLVISLDGLPLPEASPTLTASPLALISGGLASSLDVVKSLPSVTLGPPATAGYIDLSLAPADASRPPSGSYLGASWNFERNGGEILARESAVQGDWSLRAAATAHSLGDYTAGDGTVVPADDRAEGASVNLGWQSDPRHRIRFDALVSRQELAVNSALPLDTRDTTSAAFAARSNWAVSDTTSIDSRLGVELSRPYMDNSGRPMPALITADGSTRSLAGGVAIRRQSADGGEWIAGFDATDETRWLDRNRPGAVDLLWPDIQQDDAGLFAELTHPLAPDWKLRLGARVDTAQSEARAADGPAYGTTVRDLYVAYNGPSAADTTRTDFAGAANVLLTGEIAPSLDSSLGAGFARQPPDATDRYRAFCDALGGGYEIGDPSAAPEDKSELDWSLRWHPRTFTVSLDLFASDLPNYLHRVVVSATVPPGLPPGSLVYGYRATASTFWGGELEACWQPTPDTWWRLTASQVKGEDRTARQRLPEIAPPWAALSAGHAWPAYSLKPWIEAGVRATASQSNPSPIEQPIFADTAGFALGNARAGLTWRGLRMELSAENLFNRLYHDYLTPPAAAAPPSGTLAPNSRIPGPGRTFTVTVSWGLP